jgi:hypothetical protein
LAVVSELCNHFWRKAPAHWYRDNPFTLAAISTVLSQQRRMLILKAMHAGLVKVLFATQIAEVGLDFGTVSRVIQWRVPVTLSGVGLWQRWGRACRRKNMIGVGLLFVTNTAVISTDRTRNHPLALLKTSPQDATVAKVLQLIQAFDTGSKRKDIATSPTTLWPCAQSTTGSDPYEVNPVVHTAQQVRKRRRQMEPPTSIRLHDNILHSSSSESDDEDFCACDSDTTTSDDDAQSDCTDALAMDRSGTPSVVSVPCSGNSSRAPSPMPVGGSMNCPDNLGEYDERFSSTGKSTAVPTICRLLLWIVNTSGCIRECFLRYFDEAGFDSAQYRLDRPDMPTPCCDRHTPFDQLPLEYARLMPEYLGSPGSSQPHQPGIDDHTVGIASSSGLPAGSPPSTPRGVPTPTVEQSAAIQGSLRAFRRCVWNDLGLVGQYSIYPSHKLLSDDRIRILTNKSGLIYIGGRSPLAVLKLPSTDGLQPYEQAISTTICQAWESAPIAVAPQKPGRRPSNKDPPSHPPFHINPAANHDDPDVQHAQAIVDAEHERFEVHGHSGPQKRTQRSNGQFQLHSIFL